MNTIKTKDLSVEEAAQHLAAFAIDREDLKALMGTLPEDSGLNMTAVEYELGILKILSVGWGLSYFMAPTDANKAPLTDIYWQMIQEVSKNISMLTETTTGTQIDYFNILKERLDLYVAAMKESPEGTQEPANVMGPVFANACGNPDNAVAVLTGTKMFTLTLGAVREYLSTITLEDVKLN
ncbi:MAG: hypothetical protein MI747_09260 [Desulfobacterales bacterium]|nr:hypothetical protein [Desulfobacterales bacterium]